jgi:hypothetical protein
VIADRQVGVKWRAAMRSENAAVDRVRSAVKRV